MTVKEVIETVDALRPRLPQRTRESGFMSLKAEYMRICMLRTSMRESGLPIRKRF